MGSRSAANPSYALFEVPHQMSNIPPTYFWTSDAIWVCAISPVCRVEGAHNFWVWVLRIFRDVQLAVGSACAHSERGGYGASGLCRTACRSWPLVRATGERRFGWVAKEDSSLVTSRIRAYRNGCILSASKRLAEEVAESKGILGRGAGGRNEGLTELFSAS